MRHDASSLHDYLITEAADVGACGTTGSFRGVRRVDNLPVLLHRFRSPSAVRDAQPIVLEPETPEFLIPFVTHITAVIESAASLYLIEPLPPVAKVTDVWQGALQQTPQQAMDIAMTMIQSIRSLLTVDAPSAHWSQAINEDTLILAQTGVWGILASQIPTQNGPFALRPIPVGHESTSAVRPYANIVERLLAMESAASARNDRKILTEAQREVLLEWRTYDPRSQAADSITSCQWKPPRWVRDTVC
jgi:hypothetical protein